MTASRYLPPSGIQAQFQPGSNGRVLANLMGITSVRAMDQLESDALLAAKKHFIENVVTEHTRFTAKLIQAMHSYWLGDLYAWAGQYRQVNLAKGDFQWPPYGFVPQAMDAFEAGLLAECTPCRPASVSEVALQLAKVHSELLLIHPFREGNGRLARWLADLMALQAGYPLPVYRFSGRTMARRKAEYIAAVRSGYAMDFDALAAFFERRLGDAVANPERLPPPGRFNP